MAETSFLFNIFTQLVVVLIGIILLVAGRKIFWFFVGAVGFVAGAGLVATLLGDQEQWVALLVGLAAGAVGAFLALFLQQIAIGLAGFLLGGYAMVWLLQLFVSDPYQWLVVLVFVVGGFIGSGLALSVFEVALITLSSLAGALLIVQAAGFKPYIAGPLLLVLVLAGVAVQGRTTPPKPAKAKQNG
jgi:hypothetical protein